MEAIIVKPQRSWLARNWGWLVAAAFVLILSFVAAILLFVFGLIKNSDAAKLAIKTAESSPVLAEQIGSPMKVGWIATGSIEVSTDTGSAELSIPVSGPRGVEPSMSRRINVPVNGIWSCSSSGRPAAMKGSICCPPRPQSRP